MPPADSTRSLTQGETDLVQSVFKNEIDTAFIENRFYSHYKPMPGGNRPADVHAMDRKNINYYGRVYQSDDYSRETDLYNYGLFMHEMTHMWQKQGLLFYIANCETYKYTLTPESRFGDFCTEQQASLVEDYSRRMLHPTQGPTRMHIGSFGYAVMDTPETDALLQKVVEDKFPQARVTRLALEEKRKSPKAADAASPPAP